MPIHLGQSHFTCTPHVDPWLSLYTYFKDFKVFYNLKTWPSGCCHPAHARQELAGQRLSRKFGPRRLASHPHLPASQGNNNNTYDGSPGADPISKI